jgi:hypothetical protein
MNLDDRSLREHLDRRAEAGVTDVEGIAEVVVTRVAQVDRGPWWRRLGVRPPSLGVAAAAIVIVVVALAVLPPRLWPGTGSSPTSSAPTVAAAYPANRALTGAELASLLGKDPVGLVDVTLVADVTVSPNTASCVRLALCPEYIVDAPGRSIATRPLWAYRSQQPLLDPPYAFRVREDGHLDLLGSVRPGPDGLAWTLPQLTAALPDLRAADRAVPYLYLVEAIRAISSAMIFCPAAPSPSVGPDFRCGAGIAWLVPDEASIPADTDFTGPANGLRVPVPADVRGQSDALRQRGFWLVDPLVAQEPCFACPPAGAADLIGRVPTADELGLEPSGTPAASTAPPTGEPTTPPTIGPTPSADVSVPGIREITFSTDLVRLEGFETADLTVTVSFAADVVPYHGADASMTPLLDFQRDAGDTGDPLDPHISQIVRTLRESPVAGVWTATFRLTSGDRGIWHVDGLVAYDAGGQELPIGPAIRDLSPKLEVMGTNPPHLTMEVSPSPVEIGQALQISGQVTDQDSSDPLGDVVVTIGQGDACNLGGTGTTVTTNPNGAYAFVIDEVVDATVCAWISDDPGVHPSRDSDIPIALYGILFADAEGMR